MAEIKRNYDAQSLRKRDMAHHFHPFTDTRALNGEGGARIITHAEGVYLYDTEGNRILDGMAGLWCVNVGYGRRELARAAYEQMLELPYYNTFFKTTTPPAAELAARISALLPDGFDYVFFNNSGSEANDTMLRMVRTYWDLCGKPEKKTIISRHNAYHGSTVAGASLGGMAAMHAQSGLPIPGIVHIRQPYWFGEGGDMDKNEFGLLAARALEEKILELGADTVAAFIGEPIMGAGGVVIPPASYWPEINRICRKYDILLVCDEVICGFGRTGNWFGFQTFGIEPDLIPMAKGLSSGYLPISALAVSERIARTLIEKGGEFYHGYTYSGHPAAAAVALANIAIIEDEGLVEKVRGDTGPYFLARLEELSDHPIVGEVRASGLMGAVELVADKKTRQRFSPDGRAGTICRDHCFANNVIIRACGDTMVSAPPLIITRAEIDLLIERFRLSLDQTWRDLQEESA